MAPHVRPSEPPFAVRLLAAGIATLLVGTPMAPMARAQDREPAPIAVEVSGEAREAIDTAIDAPRPDVADSPEAREALDRELETSGAAASDAPDATPISLPGVEARTAVTPQAISLPSAEGSVEGMGESFAPILSSGTATFSVPIAVAPGRAGVQPSLGLSYSSTNGNGTVGFGWGIGVPFISRQTDRGLPRYIGGREWHAEEDRFLYNGGQELVPVDSDDIAAIDNRADSSGQAGTLHADVAGWQQYRARVEGGFMRFFRNPDSTRWIVQSRDGSRFDFGLLPAGQGPPEMVTASQRSLETDPESPASTPRVFRWSLTRMSDAHGSTVYYQYRYDGNQSQLESIHYVSPNSCADDDVDLTRKCSASLAQYGARVRLEYEPRQDVFSSYATGWRMDTALRVARIVVTAWNGDADGGRTLVRRYHLRYDPSSFHSVLAEVQVEGRPEAPNAQLGVSVGLATVSESSLGASIVGRVLPPMRFTYSTMPALGEQIAGFGGIDSTVHDVVDSPPHSVDDARADLFDVNSDGLADLIVTDPARYRTRDGQPAVGVFFNGFEGSGAIPAGETAHFSGAVAMPVPPALAGVMTLSNLNVVPMDIDGDGRSDLLHMPRVREYGYFTPTRAQDLATAAVSPAQQGWQWTHVPVELPVGVTDPRIDLGRDSSHLEIVDVNNDHLIDVVRTTGTVMQTWLNLGWLPGGDGRFGSYRWSGSAWTLSTEPLESCLLQSGTPLDFENPEVRLADMNGDGLLDIVEVQRGRVRYWPGRGEASWGDGPRQCARGAGAGRYIEMATPPLELNIELDNVHFTDVNADGATDIVQIRFDAIDVWFNRAGRGFTRRLIARGTPATPSFMPRIRFADIDGSGTTDVVWGTAHDWKFVDLAGGTRPRLLVRVENGLGAQTDIGYDSSAQDYVEDLADAHAGTGNDRFTWGRADGPGRVRASGPATWRAAGSPVISSVVRQVQTSDRLDVLGREAQVSRTVFAYHDGYYEGIEQEFRGFGAADAQSIGDWNHPDSFSRTFFQQGRRAQDIADDRLAYNPLEALKGREYLTETFDEAGRYLSSAHATLAIRELLVGLDGRPIQHAFVSEANELRYDTTSWTAGPSAPLELPDVVRQTYAAGATSSSTLSTRQMRIRGGGYARIRTTYDKVDWLGQVREQTAHGSVGGVWTDTQQITSVSEPILVDAASWIWRTQASGLLGPGGTDPELGGFLGITFNVYGARGDLGVSFQFADLNRVYEFAGESASEGDAPSLEQGQQLITASSRVDHWGNPIASCVGAEIWEMPYEADRSTRPVDCLRYGYVDYDAQFADHATAETAHVSMSGVTTLGASGTWDRGLGAVLTATDPNELVTSVAYDGLGRLVALLPPDIAGCEEPAPTTRIQYELTTNPVTSPISRVRSTTLLSCGGTEALLSIGYIDGLGRARAGLSTGDEGGEWIRGGLATLDAKGTARRAYQPDVFTGDPMDARSVLALPRTAASPTSFPTFAETDIPYTVTRYDAFGRAVGAHAEDGSYTTVSYHALSADSCDALDNDSSSDFYRTCTTARSDGHGRVVDQVLRTFDPNSGAPQQHRLWSYYRQDGALTDLVRAQSTGDRPTDATVQAATVDLGGSYPWVHRRFHYDSLGRRIGTDDPDTDSPDATATDANRTWRYLFNIAGDLAAVRDPRGCGQNFYYDLAGRLLGEQYISCGEAYRSNAEQPLATVPAGSIGLGVLAGAEPVDALYIYDAYPTSNDVGFVQAPPLGAAGALGRAIGAVDRGQRSVVAYDDRGNATWTARQMAYIPDAPALVAGPARPSGDNRPSWVEAAAVDGPVQYDTQVYARTARFDHAGRGIALTLPRDLTWGDPTGAPPAIGGVLHFNNRGLPARASATIGCDPVTSATACAETPIVHSIAYTRDGLPHEVEWGDAHGAHDATVSTTTYDVRRRPVRMRTLREPTDTAPQSLGSVTEVVHQELVWDVASNLTATIDHRPGDEWAPGHLPQSTIVTHDALYRVIGASFSYSHDDGRRSDEDDPGDTGLDTVDWRATQATIRDADADPMESTPAPMVPTEPDARVRDIAWSWDWLGNTTSWNDDASSFYERSIGAIQNGVDVGPSLRPSALYFSTNIPAAGAASLPAGQAGWLELEYGEGGNVTTMTVHGQCTAATCAAPSATEPSARAAEMRADCACANEQHYQYRWDELNRLSEARRWDRSTLVNWELQVRQRYRYDAANVRTVKQTIQRVTVPGATFGTFEEQIALYVYPGDFEVRGLQRGGSQYEDVGGHVEAQYVIAGARLVWQFDDGTDSEFLSSARHRRLVVPISDIIQTTAATFDVLSGELLEASSYYPNGARETAVVDIADRSAIDPNGFTSKESDEEVGLTYFGERYLISRVARWATSDPLHIHACGGGEPGNSFHYVSGNLLSARDPLGLGVGDDTALRMTGHGRPTSIETARALGVWAAIGTAALEFGAALVSAGAAAAVSVLSLHGDTTETWEIDYELTADEQAFSDAYAITALATAGVVITGALGRRIAISRNLRDTVRSVAILSRVIGAHRATALARDLGGFAARALHLERSLQRQIEHASNPRFQRYFAALEHAYNSCTRELRSSEMSGAIQEAHGIPTGSGPTRGRRTHAGEVAQGVRSLRNVARQLQYEVRSLERELANIQTDATLTPAERAWQVGVYEREVSAARATAQEALDVAAEAEQIQQRYAP